MKLPPLGIPPRRRATPDCLGELRSPSVHAEEDVNVEAGAGIAGHSPSGDFVVLSAALLATGAIVAGATPMASLGDIES